MQRWGSLIKSIIQVKLEAQANIPHHECTWANTARKKNGQTGAFPWAWKVFISRNHVMCSPEGREPTGNTISRPKDITEVSCTIRRSKAHAPIHPLTRDFRDLQPPWWRILEERIFAWIVFFFNFLQTQCPHKWVISCECFRSINIFLNSWFESTRNHSLWWNKSRTPMNVSSRNL